MEILGEVEEQWSILAEWLDIHYFKLRDIHGLYPNNSQRLRASLTHWIHTHPCPSWGLVVRALGEIKRDKVAEFVREKYVKG